MVDKRKPRTSAFFVSFVEHFLVYLLRKDRKPGVRKFRQEFEARNRKTQVRGQEANGRIPRLGSRGHSAEAGMLLYLEAEAGKPRPEGQGQEAYRQQVEDIKAIDQEIYFII
jgi:hypothetical protein